MHLSGTCKILRVEDHFFCALGQEWPKERNGGVNTSVLWATATVRF